MHVGILYTNPRPEDSACTDDHANSLVSMDCLSYGTTLAIIVTPLSR